MALGLAIVALPLLFFGWLAWVFSNGDWRIAPLWFVGLLVAASALSAITGHGPPMDDIYHRD